MVRGDLDDAASLERALAGAWGVFAVQNTWEAGVEGEEQQGKRIAEVRKFSGDFALMLEWFDAVGYDADIAGNVKAYGIKPTTFADWAAKAAW